MIMMNRFCKFGKLQAIKGEGKTLLDILLKASEELQTEETCFCYIVGMSQEEPDGVYVYEVWEDKAAHENSLKLEPVKELIQEAMPILDFSKSTNYPDLTIYGGKANF